MLSTDFSTNCAPNFIQNSDKLITLEINTRPKTKGLSAQSLTITSKVEVPNHVFYINFGKTAASLPK